MSADQKQREFAHRRILAKSIRAVTFGLILGSGLVGCGSLERDVAVGIVGATVAGTSIPGHEVEQIYYLGAFDPQE